MSMSQDMALVPRDERVEVLELPDGATVRHQLERVREFQRVVHELFKVGVDYGVIPGTGDKATLLKPGAEKLVKLLGLSDEYVFLERVEDWGTGFFNYTIRAELRSMQHGGLVATGLGSCNSWESRYRYRWLWPREVPDTQRVGLKMRSVKTKYGQQTQYRVENDDIASSANTILKMACKRALVAAALSAGRLSDVFTQDLEDLRERDEEGDSGLDTLGHEPAAPPLPPSAVRERVEIPEQAIPFGAGFVVPAATLEPEDSDNVDPTPVSDETWRSYVQLLGKANGLGLGPAIEGYPSKRTGLSERRALRYVSALLQALATAAQEAAATGSV